MEKVVNNVMRVVLPVLDQIKINVKVAITDLYSILENAKLNLFY